MTAGQPAAVVVVRLVPAPPDVVYAEWTNPEAFREWMCPRPAVATGIAVDPRPGGKLRIDIEDRGQEFFVAGKYLTVDPPSTLSFTWWCSTWPIDTPTSVVTVSFEARPGAATLMTIRHEQLPDHLLQQHETGWRVIAGQLAARTHSSTA